MKSLKKIERSVLNMPPLHHSFKGQTYDVTKSEVVRYLLENSDILQNLFDRAKQFIIYNPEDGTWRGRDYGG